MNSTTADGAVIAQPLAVDVADHGRALGAARPVAAGAILAGRERAAFRGRAGQDVVTVRRKAHAGNDLAALGQRRVHAQLVVVAVQIVDAVRDDFTLEILPRTVADAVARIDRRLAVGGLGAQIGAPGLSARAVALRQLLAMLIGALEAAEIGALAGPGADDEECHVRRLRQLWRRRRRRRLLCLDARRHADRRERQRGADDYLGLVHRGFLPGIF